MEAWDADKQLDVAISTGFPIPLVDLRVVDAAGKDVARDGKESGEIIVRAPWLTGGYYKDLSRFLAAHAHVPRSRLGASPT